MDGHEGYGEGECDECEAVIAFVVSGCWGCMIDVLVEGAYIACYVSYGIYVVDDNSGSWVTEGFEHGVGVYGMWY